MSFTLDEFQVIRNIGEGGYAKVKLVYDPTTETYYAAKLMKRMEAPDYLSKLQNEVNVQQAIEHPNVLKVIRLKLDGTYVKPDGSSQTVPYILTEYCANGSIIEYLMTIGGMPTGILESFFAQLLDGMSAIHSSGYAHRDIKPDNLLLTDEFQLKIADFGFARAVDPEGLKTQVGTRGYVAPEIYEGDTYSGELADIFACGVVLFIFKAQNPPFPQATIDNQLYSTLQANSKAFWNAHEKNQRKGGNFFEPEFRNLIECMLVYDPTDRITMQGIHNHPWFAQANKATEEQIFDYLSSFQEKIQQFRIRMSQTEALKKGRGYRDAEEEKLMLEQDELLPTWDPETMGFKVNQLLSGKDQNCIEKALQGYCTNKTFEFKQCKNNGKWKILMGELQMQVRLYKTGEALLIDFTKVLGDSVHYQTEFKSIKDDAGIQGILAQDQE